MYPSRFLRQSGICHRLPESPALHAWLFQSAMQAKGRSERSAISITRSVFTRSVYDAKWKIFVDWCGEQQIDPLRATVPQLAQFLELKGGRGLLPVPLKVTGL